MAIAGRVAIVPKGDWSADATYKRLDAVTYNNTLYFAKKEVPAGTATSNTEYWSKSIVGGAGGVATADEAGVVKPADGLTVAEDGTLKVSIDGTTLTMDQVNNVIKLADTLKDKINGAFPAANLINNLTTTEAGFGLDARQGKALDDKITEINGSLNSKFQIINPDGITKNFYYEKSIGEVGGWFRFFKITYFSETGAQGAAYNHFNVTISQVFNNGLGGNCNFDIIEEYADNPYIIQRYNTLKQIKKFRIVRSGNIIYFDFYANSINNTTIVLINIPFYKNASNISEASIVKYLIVPDVSDGEKIIKNTNLTTNN
jgi:hypothetical protein